MKAVMIDGPADGRTLQYRTGDLPPVLRIPMWGEHSPRWKPVAIYKLATVTDMGTAIYHWRGQQRG